MSSEGLPSRNPDQWGPYATPPPEPIPTFLQKYFFVIFVGFSLIFHLWLIGAVLFFDWKEEQPQPKSLEIPVELVSEEQAQTAAQKGGSGQGGSDANSSQPKPADRSPDKTQTASAKLEAPPEQQEKQQPQEKQPEAKPAPPAPQKAAAKDQSKKQLSPKDVTSEDTPQQKTPPPETPQKETRQKDLSEKPSSQQAKAVAQPEPQKPQPPQPAPPKQTPAPAAPLQGQEPQNVAAAPQRSQLPTFLNQPNDRLSLAIPAPLPTDDADAELVSYKLIVFGKLERVKEFPATARERRATGHVVIYFIVDDNGQAQNASILRSSGEADLDAEAMTMVARASPFPVPPIGAQREFAVDIGFGDGS